MPVRETERIDLSRNARDSAATAELLALAERRATGKLAVGAGGVQVAVYLLHGDLIAAAAPDDERRLLDNALELGLIDEQTHERLQRDMEDDASVFGVLLDVGGDPFDDVLLARFHQNLCDYLSSTTPPVFEDLAAVFVENVQIGHDTHALIERACTECDVALRLDLDEMLVLGHGPVGDDPARVLAADLLNDSPRVVRELLHEIPLEPTQARMAIASLVADGVAMPSGSRTSIDGFEDLEDFESMEDQTSEEAAPIAEPGMDLPAAADPDELPTLDPPTNRPDRTPDVADVIVLEDLSVDGESTPEEDVDDPPTVGHDISMELPPSRDPPTVALEPIDGPERSVEVNTLVPALDPSGLDLSTADLPPSPFPNRDDEPVDDEPTQHVPGSPNEAERGAPKSLANWLEASHEVDEEELDFFSDHDADRGGDGDGAFSTADHHRDIVTVGTPAPPLTRELPAGPPPAMAPDSAPTAAEPATASLPPTPLTGPMVRAVVPSGSQVSPSPTTARISPTGGPPNNGVTAGTLRSRPIRYGAPPLTPGEARTKLQVANEVLGTVVDAFDVADGRGRGRAVVQLLVDGVSRRFAPLMKDLTVSDRGALPREALLKNLSTRPVPEHRMLLHNSLVDIIERALSSAADALPEEHLDTVLESVAGYRKRLGL